MAGSGPSLTYAPQAGFAGSDAFSFQASDGVLVSSPATVTITVTPLSAPSITSMQVTPLVALVSQQVAATAAALLTNGGGVTYAWTFGDGTPVAGGSSVAHSYSAPGVYPVTLIATSDDGLSDTKTLNVTVSLGIKAPGSDSLPPGVAGTPVTKTNGKAAVVLNMANALGSSFTGEVEGIVFPAGVTQSTLTGKSGTLTLAGGNPYGFELDQNGTGKNGGLNSLQLNLKKQTLTFKISKDPTLNGLFRVLPGFSYTPPQKGAPKPSAFTLYVPALLSLDNDTYPIGVTFIVRCAQTGAAIKGSAVTTP